MSFLSGFLPPITKEIAMRGAQTGDSAGEFTDYKPTMGKRDTIYYDENMQPYDPKTRKEDGSPSIMKGPMNPAVVMDIVSKPSAIVVGSGLPGVHMAYELARKGFQVDVYEAQATPGCGNTPFMNPIVGGKFETPAVLDRFSPYQSLGNALRFIPGCSDPWIKIGSDPYTIKTKKIIMGDFTRSFRSIVRNGGGGFWKGSNKDEWRDSIVARGGSLSRQSAAKVHQMLLDHPRLRDAVVTPLHYPELTSSAKRSADASPSGERGSSNKRSIWSKITFGLIGSGDNKKRSAQSPNSSRSSDNDQIATDPANKISSSVSATAEFEGPVTISPLNWTQTLAQVCSEEYGVRFHFDTQVTSASVDSYGDTKLINGLYLMRKLNEAGGTKNAKNKEELASMTQTTRADLYVFAAGVTNPIMLSYLVGFSPLMVTSGTASIFELKRREDAPKVEGSSSTFVKALRSALLQQKSDSFYFFPSTSTLRFSHSEIPFSRKHSEKSGMLVGGQRLCVDMLPHTTKGSPMDVFTNVFDELFGKLSSTSSAGLSEALSEAGSLYRQSRKTESTARDFHSYTFYKTSTADGLPVASRVGPFFNTFVIGGFGDNSPALAPQVASELAHTIAHPRDAEVQSPLPLDRFAPDHRGLQPDKAYRPLEERIAPLAGLNFTQKVERRFNKYITEPIGRVFHEMLLRIVASPYTPSGLAYSLYLGHVTAEDEERLTGMKAANIVEIKIPMITPDTALSPPDTPKDLDFREGVVRARDY